MPDLPEMGTGKDQAVKGRAHFAPGGNPGLIDGVPLEEMAMELEVSNCIRCGRAPGDTEGGTIENYRVENGVLKGDCVCLECLEKDDPDGEGVRLVKGME